ncbi:MAG: tRNA pseudouridine(55) synthase TruB, partial [Deltaproteobacteria bacterium]|nr:tRNA pseudouridine(55) synthase TruB [Deltaproteobacteria bacterium]MBW2536955.1 tRNA pseudouridine(55) synthase TruB [Deltaproteobacteria bacterium]
RRRTEQLPPAFSAIKVAGRAAHRRARAGETVELPPRQIAVRSLRALLPEEGSAPWQPSADPCCLDLALTVSKGYYVRSLARDLGHQLGLPAHLTRLRRTASGSFDLSQAVLLEQDGQALADRVLPLAEAARRALPAAILTMDGARRAACGQALQLCHFAEPPTTSGPTAWLTEAGTLAAVGRLEPDGQATVIRGFT